MPAKINLSLSVGPRRPDGYHDLTTVYQAVSLYDEVVVSNDGAPGLRLFGEGGSLVPTGPDNLAWRAATVLAAHAGCLDRLASLQMVLYKEIPVAGGMAGGSADAAGALVALTRLWDLDIPDAELAVIATALGCDVPFTLVGGTALGTGRGERLMPLPAATTLHWVVALSRHGLSTPAVFAELDRIRRHARLPRAEAPIGLIKALADGGPRDIAPYLENDLQVAAVSLDPGLATTLAVGQAAGAVAGLVSGSGPTCLFLCESRAAAAEVAATLELKAHCRQALVVRSPIPGPIASRGVEMPRQHSWTA
ncbi:4-(cytidine 5'-diphospho)-2-C-methyl-D-erythritol kinase [Kutzneria sp. NPDC052558]|uniref:4-(cytidine 5'-diphospho)-2-C-methyl-D-erythritol kinase n=1 Tax=Kutzneria sp. NPDC052558 TaxID=3364121 RepID=UPI0037C77C4D